MRRSRLIWAALCLMLAAPAQADTLSGLMADASRLSGLPPVEAPQMSTGVCAFACGAAMIFEGSTDAGTVHINPEIDLGTLTGQSLLVHELVHAMQWQHSPASEWIDCARKERLAYEVQKAWIEERGASFSALTGWRTIGEAVRKSCDWL